MKIISNIKILNNLSDYVSFKYEGIGKDSGRPTSMCIGIELNENGSIKNYHCCMDYRTLKGAIREAEIVVIPIKPHMIWR